MKYCGFPLTNFRFQANQGTVNGLYKTGWAHCWVHYNLAAAQFLPENGLPIILLIFSIYNNALDFLHSPYCTARMVNQLQKPNHRIYSDCTRISVHQKTNPPPQVHRCHLLSLLSEPYRRVSCRGLLLLHFSSKQHLGRDMVFVGTKVPAN